MVGKWYYTRMCFINLYFFSQIFRTKDNDIPTLLFFSVPFLNVFHCEGCTIGEDVTTFDII